MQATRPNSAVSSPSLVTSLEDTSCLSKRATKIALAIFASLAGFVFLPFGLAIILSATVTVGAIFCCEENEKPQVPLDPKMAQLQSSFEKLMELKKKHQQS